MKQIQNLPFNVHAVKLSTLDASVLYGPHKKKHLPRFFELCPFLVESRKNNPYVKAHIEEIKSGSLDAVFSSTKAILLRKPLAELLRSNLGTIRINDKTFIPIRQEGISYAVGYGTKLSSFGPINGTSFELMHITPDIIRAETSEKPNQIIIFENWETKRTTADELFPANKHLEKWKFNKITGNEQCNVYITYADDKSQRSIDIKEETVLIRNVPNLLFSKDELEGEFAKKYLEQYGNLKMHLTYPPRPFEAGLMQFNAFGMYGIVQISNFSLSTSAIWTAATGGNSAKDGNIPASLSKLTTDFWPAIRSN